MKKVKSKSGKTVYLLNPSERAKKFSIEMKHKKALTNNGKRKIDDKTGKQVKLSGKQMAFRAGYLAHQKDSNKAFKSKHPRYRRKSSK